MDFMGVFPYIEGQWGQCKQPGLSVRAGEWPVGSMQEQLCLEIREESDQAPAHPLLPGIQEMVLYRHSSHFAVALVSFLWRKSLTEKAEGRVILFFPLNVNFLLNSSSLIFFLMYCTFSNQIIFGQ